MNDCCTEFEFVTRCVRACFNRLREVGDQLHQDIGITSAQRAVLETLYENGAQTVPQIARSKSVSRQHIQVIVDSLSSDALIEAVENPAHKRSPLIQLTPSARKIFAKMRRKEAKLIKELAEEFAFDDLEVTARTLSALRDALDRQLG